MMLMLSKLAGSHILGYIKDKSAIYIARTYEGRA